VLQALSKLLEKGIINNYILEWLKNKIFNQGIGITEKSLVTRRDRLGAS